MATPNGRGGWDLTDEDVAEVMATSFPDLVRTEVEITVLGGKVSDDGEFIEIPLVEVSFDDEDFTTPEGHDDSPDQGVHRHDGGGAFF